MFCTGSQGCDVPGVKNFQVHRTALRVDKAKVWETSDFARKVDKVFALLHRPS